MPNQWAWPGEGVAMQVARPLGAFALTLVILLFLRRRLTRWLYRRSRGEGTLGYVALETLRVPSILWCIAAAVAIGLEMSFIPDKFTGRAATAIAAFLIISFS